MFHLHEVPAWSGRGFSSGPHFSDAELRQRQSGLSLSRCPAVDVEMEAPVPSFSEGPPDISQGVTTFRHSRFLLPERFFRLRA